MFAFENARMKLNASGKATTAKMTSSAGPSRTNKNTRSFVFSLNTDQPQIDTDCPHLNPLPEGEEMHHAPGVMPTSKRNIFGQQSFDRIHRKTGLKPCHR